MIKKIVSIFLAIVFSVAMVGGTVWAHDISTYDINGHVKYSTLSITNKTATCKSTYYSSSNDCESITVVQTLEKYSWLFFWDTIGDECKTTVYSDKKNSFVAKYCPFIIFIIITLSMVSVMISVMIIINIFMEWEVRCLIRSA